MAMRMAMIQAIWENPWETTSADFQIMEGIVAPTSPKAMENSIRQAETEVRPS